VVLVEELEEEVAEGGVREGPAHDDVPRAARHLGPPAVLRALQHRLDQLACKEGTAPS
jgi:hypothetical protein